MKKNGKNEFTKIKLQPILVFTSTNSVHFDMICTYLAVDGGFIWFFFVFYSFESANRKEKRMSKIPFKKNCH